MNNSTICPICDKRIEDYHIDTINHTMCEEHATCSDEHHYYSYTYEYGNSIETIGNIAFHEYWSSKLSKQERDNLNRLYYETLRLAREEYRKKVS